MYLSKKTEDIVGKGTDMEPVLCYIRESYFKEHTHFVKMLDTGNVRK